MGVFFRLILRIGFLSWSVLLAVTGHAQEDLVPLTPDFESVDQDIHEDFVPPESSPDQEFSAPMDPELDGGEASESDGVQPYEPTPEEPFPEGLTPAEGEGTDVEEAAPDPVSEESSLDPGSADGELTQDSAVPSTTEKEKWISPFHSKSWPGSFMAVRMSFAAGNALVPQFGTADEIRPRAAISQIAPYAGIELGSTKRRWGGSFSLEGTLLGSQPSFLSAPPVHVFVSLNVYHAPKDSKYRWALGIRPFIHYGMEATDGQFLHLRGYGFHLGVHRLLSRTQGSAFEAFVTVSMDRFTEAVGGVGGDEQTYPIGDLIGARRLSAAYMIEAGIQFAWLQ